ncbi:hypothetical protein AYO44_10590 [Planctomycetaceae bacterium SCGC AG-212-F19]|nr:hypothetical protein AYO44_10590 [Planctomycetaceae bacterium SCGC AG-212-F19]
MLLETRRRNGLTLMELIVVLVILVALAGVLIPLLPSMVKRAHTASGATNTSEITKYVQTYQQLYLSYPDEWDALTDGTTMISYLPGTVDLIADSPTATEVAALQAAGVGNVHYLSAAPGVDPWTPTFNPYATQPTPGGPKPAPIAITTSTKLVFLDPATNAAALKMGQSGTGRYVVMGLGKRCTLVGKVATDAPVHFGDGPQLNAANFYMRFAAVFKVSDTNPGVVINQAVFVGAVGIHDDGIAGTDSHLEEYYNTTKAQ